MRQTQSYIEFSFELTPQPKRLNRLDTQSQFESSERQTTLHITTFLLKWTLQRG